MREVLDRFGQGTLQRQLVVSRLKKIYNLADGTGKLERFVIYGSFITSKENPNDVDVRTDLGSTFMERPNPDFDRAIKEYRASLNINPAHENTLFNISLALMRKGDKQGAQEMLNQFEKVSPQSPLIAKLKQKLAEANSN